MLWVQESLVSAWLKQTLKAYNLLRILQVFSPFLVLISLCSSDGAARIICFSLQFFFIPTYTTALGFEPASVELHQTGPLKEPLPTKLQHRGKRFLCLLDRPGLERRTHLLLLLLLFLLFSLYDRNFIGAGFWENRKRNCQVSGQLKREVTRVRNPLKF